MATAPPRVLLEGPADNTRLLPGYLFGRMRAVRFEPYDSDAVRREVAERCFICEMLAGNAEFRHHVFYEDETAVAFLNKYPPLYGYSLVAPKQHRERVTGDFAAEEYLALQDVVYRVGEALQRTVSTERLYILSLGSEQAKRHVHWHVAPLPPGIRFKQQQFAALSRPQRAVISEDEMASLADRLRQALP